MLVAQTVRSTVDKVDFISGAKFPADYAYGVDRLTLIADMAYNAGSISEDVIESIHRNIAFAQTDKVRVTSELSAIKRDARRAGRNLRK